MTHTDHDDAPGTVIDLAKHRTRMGEAAREAVHATPAGLADLTTGTVRLPSQAADDGGLLEQPGDDEPQLRPIVPAAFTDPAVWRHRRTVAIHAVKFHAVRSPLYLCRAARVSALGAWVAARDAWSYVFATEYGELVDQVRRTGAGPEHIADLRADRRKVAAERRREPLVVYGATGATTYTAALVALAQAWSLALVVPALLPLVAVLFVLGRREMARRQEAGGGPVFTITDALATAEEGRALLGAESITAAFRRAGVLKADEEVSLVGPVRAVQIHAAEAVIDLPGDLTVSELEKAREKIAAAFRVEPSWVDFRMAGHPGRCRLWVASENPFGEARQSPLLTSPAQTDVWNAGVPLGYNRRGETVTIRLRHVMALLGGMSRTGKGMALRNIICGLALDPRVNLRLVAGAKPGEHRGYAPACATFFGRRPERLVALLDAVLAEAYRREEHLEDQGRAKLGEGDLDRFPLEIVVIDEAKQYLTKGAPHADRIADQLEELAAFAAALNITVLVCTQDPDANTIPRGFKNNSGARIATRTGSATQTNAILKDGATGAGLRAHDIPTSLKGGAIVDIDGAEGELIRSFFIEDEKYDGAAPIIEAAVKLRRAAGRAPGQFTDPIEDHLLRVTGQSSVAGGPTGSGRPGAPAQAPEEWGILSQLLAVFEQAGNPPYLRTADVLAGLARLAPEPWAAIAAGDPRRAGRELAQAIKDTGRELAARERSWGRGYLLDEVRAAAGIAPK